MAVAYAVYWRHHNEYKAGYETNKEAFDFLKRGSNETELAAYSVIRTDGVEVKHPYYGGDEAEWEALGDDHHTG